MPVGQELFCQSLDDVLLVLFCLKALQRQLQPTYNSYVIPLFPSPPSNFLSAPRPLLSLYLLSEVDEYDKLMSELDE